MNHARRLELVQSKEFSITLRGKKYMKLNVKLGFSAITLAFISLWVGMRHQALPGGVGVEGWEYQQ